MPPNNKVTWKWLAVTVVGILILAASAWASYMMGQDNQISRKIDRAEAKLSLADSRTMGIEATLIQFQTQLNRIEMRLDQVLTDTGHPGKARPR